jgi:hypothetical protein
MLRRRTMPTTLNSKGTFLPTAAPVGRLVAVVPTLVGDVPRSEDEVIKGVWVGIIEADVLVPISCVTSVDVFVVDSVTISFPGIIEYGSSRSEAPGTLNILVVNDRIVVNDRSEPVAVTIENSTCVFVNLHNAVVGVGEPDNWQSSLLDLFKWIRE